MNQPITFNKKVPSSGYTADKPRLLLWSRKWC